MKSFTAIDASWYEKASMLASTEGAGIGNEGEQDCVHATNIKEMFHDYGYETSDVDLFCQGSTTVSDLSAAFNDGRTLINYTGHGFEGGWAAPTFSNSNITSLTNSNKLPMVLTVGCSVGSFDEYDENSSVFSERCKQPQRITQVSQPGLLLILDQQNYKTGQPYGGSR